MEWTWRGMPFTAGASARADQLANTLPIQMGAKQPELTIPSGAHSGW
jgi:hypothetical protein